jgi:hypothetical protein
VDGGERGVSYVRPVDPPALIGDAIRKPAFCAIFLA